MTQPTPEPVTPSQVAAQRIKELRSKRGWSARVLAERCMSIGAPSLNRPTIANIEAGRRTYVSVDELFVLACALEVSPLALLLPAGSTDYALAPKRVAPVVIRVYDWIIGRVSQPFNDPNADPFSGWDGIPAGLPDWLAARERLLISERDAELNALRAQMTELAMKVVRSERKDPSDAPLSGVSDGGEKPDDGEGTDS